MKTKYAHFNWKRLNIVLAIIAIFLFAPVTAGALEETLTFEGQDTVAISSFTEGCFTVAKYGGILNPVIAERGVEGNQCIENSTPGCQTLIITATEGGDFSLKHFDLAIFNCTLVVGYPCPTNVYIRGYDGEDKVFGFATAN